MTTQKKPSRPPHDGEQDPLRFEQALERLETIVTEMEDGDLDLETMISRFEEGRRHLKSCSAKLNDVERRIEMLVKKDDTVTLEPFDASLSGESEGDASETSKSSASRKSSSADDAGELPF